MMTKHIEKHHPAHPPSSHQTNHAEQDFLLSQVSDGVLFKRFLARFRVKLFGLCLVCSSVVVLMTSSQIVSVLMESSLPVDNSSNNKASHAKVFQNASLDACPDQYSQQNQEHQTQFDGLDHMDLDNSFVEGTWPRSTPIIHLFDGPGAPYLTQKGIQQLVFPHAATSTSGNSEDVKKNPAVCEFKKSHDWTHFAHTMQQLYTCFSWWQANPDLQPILYIKDIPVRSPSAPFIQDYIRALQEVFGVQVEHTEVYKNISVHTKVITNTFDQSIPAYAMRSPQDAQTLRQGILKHYVYNSSNTNATTTTAGCPAHINNNPHHHRRCPAIGFLNRKSSRRVDNYREVLQRLRRGNPQNTVFSSVCTGPQKIQYLDSFDHKTFIEQITFMSQIDILIGPHGAQFTSTLFLPECGGLIEIFPKGYYIPNFFGSLARATGHEYVSIYTGTNGTNQTAEIDEHMNTFKGRTRARGYHIQVHDPAVVAAAVQKLTLRWQSCCRRPRRQVLPEALAPKASQSSSSDQSVRRSMSEQSTTSSRRIAFIHIGKNAGNTIRSALPRLACFRIHREDREEKCWKHTQSTKSLLRNSSDLEVHMEYTRLEQLKTGNYTSFLIPLRNPLARAVSAYSYLHYNNTESVYAQIHNEHKDQFYKECFPALADLLQAVDQVFQIYSLRKSPTTSRATATQAMTTLTDCQKLAVLALQGTIDRIKDINVHLYYNYEYYANHSIRMFPEMEVLVVRTEYLWQDLIHLDQSLGGPGRFKNQGQGRNQNSNDTLLISMKEHGRGNSIIQPHQQLQLCCVLWKELQVYQDILLGAINLNESDKNETVKNLADQCGITASYKATSMVDWRGWYASSCPDIDQLLLI